MYTQSENNKILFISIKKFKMRIECKFRQINVSDCNKDRSGISRKIKI